MDKLLGDIEETDIENGVSGFSVNYEWTYQRRLCVYLNRYCYLLIINKHNRVSLISITVVGIACSCFLFCIGDGLRCSQNNKV